MTYDVTTFSHNGEAKLRSEGKPSSETREFY